MSYILRIVRLYFYGRNYSMNQSKNVDVVENGDKKKGVIFARVSTLRQEKEGLSLQKNQVPEAKKYAERKNIEIVQTFAVSETGGRYKKRKEFDKMIEFIKNHPEVTEVVTFKVNRLMRNLIDVVTVDDLRLNHGKRFHFIQNNIILEANSNRQEVLMWGMLALFAKDYLEGVREDGIETKETKLKYGELPWKAPYGYKNVSKGHRRTVEIAEPEATIVKEIFEKYSTGAYSCDVLAEEMNMEYGALGQKFQGSKIQRILSEPFYIGKIYDKKRKQLFPHNYPTLIDIVMFNKCEKVRVIHGQSHIRAKGKDALIYRGMLVCKECGCTISPDPKTRRRKDGTVREHYYYHCSNGKNIHEHQHNVSEEKIDDAVRETLAKIILPPISLKDISDELLKAHADKIEFYQKERGKLAKRRSLIKGRQQNSYDLLVDQTITKEEYDENNQRYQIELQNISEKEMQLDGVDEKIYTQTDYLKALFDKLSGLFKAGTLENKREILGLLFSRITLDGDDVEFSVNPDFIELF